MSLTSDSTRIERDLDETRSRLGSHLDELQDKLSPGQVVDDLMTYFRGSEGAAFGRNLVANILENPMPAAITGVGLAWLMASNALGGGLASSGSTRPQPQHYGRDETRDATLRRVNDAEQGLRRDADEPEPSYAERLNAARGQALGLSQHAQETAQSFSQRVKDALSSAQQTVTATVHDLKDQAGGAASATAGAFASAGSSAQSFGQTAYGAAGRAGDGVSRAGQAAGQMGRSAAASVLDSPVLLGALGLAAGALLGALVPRSEQEEAALGGLARQARDAATDLAHQGVEGGKHVAQAVADKTKESAGGHDLGEGKTPGQYVDSALSGDLAGNASAVLRDALKSGEEAVRREFSNPAAGSGAPSAKPSPSRNG